MPSRLHEYFLEDASEGPNKGQNMQMVLGGVEVLQHSFRDYYFLLVTARLSE